MLARLRASLCGGTADIAPIGRYRPIAPLGRGAMGTVYLADDPQLQRRVALKLIPIGDSDPARLLEEARSLAKLSHPNVVAVHDAGIQDDAVFIAMEYIDGPTLDEWLGSERRRERAIIRVMLEAGRGLGAAHRVGIVHRDFKPKNVMIGADDRVRVVDFGLARSQANGVSADHAESRGTSPAGTPAYMAPEQRLGELPTPQSDQYSFCVTFYEALTGRRPSRGLVRSPRVRWFKPIIARGLDEDPRRRHESIDALVDRFERRRFLRLAAALSLSAVLGSLVTFGGVRCSEFGRKHQKRSDAESEVMGRGDRSVHPAGSGDRGERDPR